MNEALADAIRYLDRGGDVAIIDGTNISKERRKVISDTISSLNGHSLLWIESAKSRSNESEISDSKFDELRQSPDFLDKDDYSKKLQHFISSYETVEEDEGSFIKVILNTYLKNKHGYYHDIYFFF